MAVPKEALHWHSWRGGKKISFQAAERGCKMAPPCLQSHLEALLCFALAAPNGSADEGKGPLYTNIQAPKKLSFPPNPGMPVDPYSSTIAIFKKEPKPCVFVKVFLTL